MFEVGDTLGHHRIVSRLSEGGMATLYLGRDIDAPADAPPVAIKVIHEHLSEDWQFVRMFVDEALISVRLRHPNVIRVDELGEHQNVYYLVMEYVHGCSLAQLLRAMSREGRRMRPEIAIWIAQQIAAGLHAAHEMTGHDGAVLGVIHRDVSPQNILLAVGGEAKLLDFGIAKARGRAERTETGVIKGKLRYMAPEQATGGEIDRRIDIYALGVVLWEMLTMRRYVEGGTDVEVLRRVQSPDPVPPSFRVEGIDPRIDDAVMAAIRPSREQRPPTAAHFYHSLASAVPAGTVGPPQVAELLQLFVADELESTARSLPPDVVGALKALVRSAPWRKGEPSLSRSSEQTVGGPALETLTRRVVAGTLEDPRDSEPTRARPSAERAPEPIAPSPSDDVPARSPSRPEARREELAEAAPLEPAAAKLVRFGQDEDEATVEASGAELAAFLHSIRPPAEAPAPARPAELIAPPPPSPPIAPRAPLTAGWIVRVLIITLLAFVLGAGAAIAWVRLVAG